MGEGIGRTTGAAFLASVAAEAQRVLSDALGRVVRLGPPVRQGGTKVRSVVLRCPVAEGPPGTPDSVIVKCVRPGPDAPYDLQDFGVESGTRRLLNEWAASRFLGQLPHAPPLSARLHGVDRDAGILVLDDLGPGACLVDALQGDDPDRALEGLLAYARGLGRLHGVTAGRAPDFERLRAEVGLPPSEAATAAQTFVQDWLEKEMPDFRRGVEGLGIAPAAGFDAEVQTVAQALGDPGPFLAFSPGDTCPDNHRFVPDPRGDPLPHLRFFDFEFCEYRHALLDAAYLGVPFPTCWCVNRLPDEAVARALAIYRAGLSVHCPAAADDLVFEPALSAAWAYWTIATVGWNLSAALDEDDRWGTASLRQRHLLRLDTFAARSDECGHLPAIGATARAVAARLRDRWGPDAEMPPYPAFGVAGEGPPA